MGNEAELRILCRLRNRVGRVRNNEPARSAPDRGSRAHKALVGVEPGPQGVGVRANLGEHWIQFAWNRGAIGYVVAAIARGFQLPRAVNPFFEGRPLIVVDGRARFWVRTDQRRMRDRNPSRLQPTSSVCEPSTYTGIAHTRVAIRSSEHTGRIEQ